MLPDNFNAVAFFKAEGINIELVGVVNFDDGTKDVVTHFPKGVTLGVPGFLVGNAGHGASFEDSARNLLRQALEHMEEYPSGYIQFPDGGYLRIEPQAVVGAASPKLIG